MTPPPGHDDPRVRLAVERTQLAWVRTGLALMGFGFVVARFGLFLRELAAVRPDNPPRPGTMSVWVGTTLVLIGVGANVYAAVDLGRLLRRLDRGDRLVSARGWAGTIVATMLAALGLLIAWYLAFVTH
jgi:putative membrane protein